MIGAKWWHVHSNLTGLANWLIAEGRLATAEDVLYFFEKPWKWDPEWDEWGTSQMTRAQLEL